MNTRDVTPALTGVMSELLNGTAPSGGLLLNSGDKGIVDSLDKLSAADASQRVSNGSSIAAHVAHVAFYANIINRVAAGENPWDGADWTLAWKKPVVSAEEWEKIKRDLADEHRKWLTINGEAREVTTSELTYLVASIAHLAYHLGAIRQMDRHSRGPGASREIEAATAPAPRP
jgi:uncharacterized damage-inducible protein DinB